MGSVKAWIPRGLGFLAFAFYAGFVPAGPYFLDSQELGAAAVRMGSPHPTGFPLLVVLGQLLAWVPLGELAFRLHLASAAAGGLAVALAARLAVEADRADDGASLTGAALAAAVLAGSATFFRAATVFEVYAPTAAVLLGALVLANRVAAGGPAPSGLALAFLLGLGAAGLHTSLRALVVLPVLLLAFVRLRRGARWPLGVPALLVLGAAGILLYLPLRSASGHVAAIDWGHPSTVAALWNHAVGAARIRTAFADEILSQVPEVVGWNVRRLAALQEADLGLFALLAAAGGLLALLAHARGRVLAVLLLVVAAGDFAFGAWVNPMGIEERQTGIALAAALSVLAGVGGAALARRFGRAGPYAGAALAFMVALPAVLGAAREKRATRGDAARAWSEAALADCPSRAVALVMNDSTAAGLFWLGQVEAARPDVPVLVRQHLWDERRTRAVLGVTGARLDEAHACLEPGPDVPALPGQIPLAVPAAAPAGDAEAELSALFAPPADDDPNARRLHALSLAALGRAALSAHDRAAAFAHFRAAAAVDPESPQPWVNLGTLAAQAGDLRLAVTLTERALALRPNHPTALVNQARYLLAAHQDAAARRHAHRATRVAPDRADGWALLGVLEARAGEYAIARRHLERALSLDPQNPDAKANLGRLP